MLKEILAISGKSGLFKFISSSPKIVIVEALADGKRTQVRTDAKVISLGDIAIYTDEEEVPLTEVLKQMKENANGQQVISHKESDDKIRAIFEAALPNYDRDRVYMSDMRKVVLWYNQLCESNLLNFEEEQKEQSAE